MHANFNKAGGIVRADQYTPPLEQQKYPTNGDTGAVTDIAAIDPDQTLNSQLQPPGRRR